MGGKAVRQNDAAALPAVRFMPRLRPPRSPTRPAEGSSFGIGAADAYSRRKGKRRSPPRTIAGNYSRAPREAAGAMG